jgi:hypothetical protein
VMSVAVGGGAEQNCGGNLCYAEFCATTGTNRFSSHANLYVPLCLFIRILLAFMLSSFQFFYFENNSYRPHAGSPVHRVNHVHSGCEGNDRKNQGRCSRTRSLFFRPPATPGRWKARTEPARSIFVPAKSCLPGRCSERMRCRNRACAIFLIAARSFEGQMKTCVPAERRRVPKNA